MNTSNTLRHHRLRLLPTLLLVVVVALVSAAGTATAAKLITGKQIKNGTITSVDLKDGTVTGTDLRNGGVTGTDLRDGSVTGPDLAPAAVGRGQLTTEALLDAGAANVPSIDVTNCPDQTLQVCPSLQVLTEFGPLVVTMSGTLENLEAAVPTPTRCGIVQDGSVRSVVQFAPGAEGDPGHLVPFTLQAVVHVDDMSERPELRCTQFAGDDLRVTNLVTTAVEVHLID